MMLVVQPTLSLKGSITLPSSKSYSIRTVIIAACGGRSKISNLSSCDDVKQALKASRSLGSKIQLSASSKKLIIRSCHIQDIKFIKVDAGESGTVLRFLLPLLALRKSFSVVTGEGTLKTRPNKFLTSALRKMGKEVYGHGAKETVPIQLGKGILKGGDVCIDGSLSSQFISALLIACPLLDEDTRLKISGKTIVSVPYIEMTTCVLRRAGIKIVKDSNSRYIIKGHQIFKGLRNFTVPSDDGLAAFLLAAAALTSSHVLLKGFFDNTLIQADSHIFNFLKKMGVVIKKKKQSLEIKGPFVLKGGRFSLKNCPDLVPIMAVLGLFAKGKTRLCDIAHARAKESDRISDLRQELLKTGAKIEEKKGELIIYPQPIYKGNVYFDPHHDHRLAMALSVLGLKIGAQVKDIECVTKSYPGFVSDLQHIGGKLKKR